MRCITNDKIITRKKKLRSFDDKNTIFLNIIYYIIFNKEAENVNDERIYDQHNTLNRDFNGFGKEQVPSTGMYNFRSVVGNPNISFKIQEIVRVKTEQTSFKDLVEIEHLVSSRENVINVFVCNLEDSVLGQAQLFSNSCVIHHMTVGGENVKGVLPFYNLGKTLTHELGHCFGLPHIFNGTCFASFPDIPAQKNPNFHAVLVNGGNYDNVYRDCYPENTLPELNVLPPYSCHSTSCNIGEMFMNHMDYGDDRISVMFSKSQVDAMRQFIINEMSHITPSSSSSSSTTIIIIIVAITVIIILVLFLVNKI